MFKSRVRAINIPQYEHGRLAGILASLWGNDDFDRPVIDFASFVQGVALHDWHYGVLDNLPIKEADQAEWLDMVRQGVEYWFDDPVTDIVAKLHIRRLLAGRDSPEAHELVDLIEVRVAERLPHTDHSGELFEWADKITRFCDNVAFDFSFEKPTRGSTPVYARVNSTQETPLTYTIGQDGEIRVEPWPFALTSFSGIVIGYERTGYPNRLQPLAIPYHCRPA